MIVAFRNAYRLISNYICMQYLGKPTLNIFSNPKYEKTLSNFYFIDRIHKGSLNVHHLLFPTDPVSDDSYKLVLKHCQ